MNYRFDKIAFNSIAKKTPTESDKEHYIGLEHIDSECLEITRWGSDVAPIGEKLIMKKGDVLFGKRRAYQRKLAIAPFDGIFSAHGMVLRPNEEVVDKNYFPFFMSSDLFMERAVQISVGGLSPTINWKDLREQEFPLPSLAEQKVLADKLWAAYRLKESYKKLLATTEEMVKSQFIEMFKGDFPTLNWEECLTITNGKKYDDDYQETGTYPICGSGGIMGYGERMLCPKDTIILGRKGNINSPIYMETDYWIVDTAFCLDVDRTKLHPKYFYFWCKLFDFTRYNKQGVLPSLTKNDLLKIEMPIPPMALQTKFVDIIKQADKSGFELRKSIDAIDAVIKSLINN